MSTKSRLDKLYKDCKRIRLPEDTKILFISDLHMNDGCEADDFRKNNPLCQEVLTNHFQEYYLVLAGDVEDIWEAQSREKILATYPEIFALFNLYENAGRLIRIKGNHDNSLNYPEAVVLQIGEGEIFCAHLHQGDFFNDTAWWVGQNVVRYLWVPLQWIGLHDARKAKQKRHEAQEVRAKSWADNQPFITIGGHTHLLRNEAKYKNAGCWVRQGGEAIEFSDGKFTDKHF